MRLRWALVGYKDAADGNFGLPVGVVHVSARHVVRGARRLVDLRSTGRGPAPALRSLGRARSYVWPPHLRTAAVLMSPRAPHDTLLRPARTDG